MTVTLLDSSQSPVGSPFVSSPYTLASTAPDPIPSFTTASTDGRHRQITFDIPLDNGAEIEYIVLRRTSGGSDAFFYNVSCAVASVACDSYVPVCYTTPPPCSTAGSTFSFTVGLDQYPAMAAYLTPTQSYEWSLIGERPRIAPAHRARASKAHARGGGRASEGTCQRGRGMGGGGLRGCGYVRKRGGPTRQSGRVRGHDIAQ